MDDKIKYLHDCIIIKDILVIGDIHIGHDGVHGRAMFPKAQLDNIIEKLERVFDNLENEKVNRVVLLGDVKHDFGKISDAEWRETLELLDYLKKKCDKIIVIKGNHDTMLEPILKKRNVLLKDYYKVRIDGESWCFLHGNEMFKQCLDSDWLVFGHLHPAITLYDKYKGEKFKCFLKGKWEGKKVLILPSFSEFSLGYDLSDVENLESRKGDRKRKFFVIENKDLKKMDVVIYNSLEKKVHDFGKLRKII
ncbi:hypothetical protein CMI42_05450 [Candidatus Pacearchaeota archaeon]|nr:hypothetical protein [Candidatus Pacearchaeota archaeon]|tara:strand:- start:1864 stop:2613 length:750 start_codon:yes stop_codon:yes gene_type:complete